MPGGAGCGALAEAATAADVGAIGRGREKYARSEHEETAPPTAESHVNKSAARSAVRAESASGDAGAFIGGDASADISTCRAPKRTGTSRSASTSAGGAPSDRDDQK
jgi:hypothetical protein